MVRLILPGLDTVLSGLYTLGDLDSRILPTVLIPLLDDVDEFPFNLDTALLSDENFVYYPDWLAYDGDASGNGWTNEQIYAYYAPDGRDAYVNAALDSSVMPYTGEGYYFEGDFVRIAVLEHSKWNSPWQWRRDGVPLVDDGRITGANRRNLDILSLQASDTGAYTCDYNPKSGTKLETYGPINIVVADGPVPAGSSMALAAIALAIGGAGAVALRRKKK